MSADKQSSEPVRPRLPWVRWAMLGALLLVLAAGAWAYRQTAPYARVGGVYIAKQYCSCLFVAGRSEASCRAEFKPDIDKFSVTVDRSGLPAAAAVRTRLLMFSAEATYDSRYGCTVAR